MLTLYQLGDGGLPQLVYGDFQSFGRNFNLNTAFGVTQINATKRHFAGAKFDVFTWVLDILETPFSVKSAPSWC